MTTPTTSIRPASFVCLFIASLVLLVLILSLAFTDAATPNSRESDPAYSSTTAEYAPPEGQAPLTTGTVISPVPGVPATPGDIPPETGPEDEDEGNDVVPDDDIGSGNQTAGLNEEEIEAENKKQSGSVSHVPNQELAGAGQSPILTQTQLSRSHHRHVTYSQKNEAEAENQGDTDIPTDSNAASEEVESVSDSSELVSSDSDSDSDSHSHQYSNGGSDGSSQPDWMQYIPPEYRHYVPTGAASGGKNQPADHHHAAPADHHNKKPSDSHDHKHAKDEKEAPPRHHHKKDDDHKAHKPPRHHHDKVSSKHSRKHSSDHKLVDADAASVNAAELLHSPFNQVENSQASSSSSSFLFILLIMLALGVSLTVCTFFAGDILKTLRDRGEYQPIANPGNTRV